MLSGYTSTYKAVPLLSAGLLLVLAIVSVGWYHPDEHFQILEFAALKLNLCDPSDLAWEYHARMRSAIQPAMVVFLHKSLSLVGITNPFTITLFLRLFSAALSFLAMWMIYKRYSTAISNPRLQKWFLQLSFLLWFALYNFVRFSSETWSGAFFILGFCYLYLLKREPRPADFFITGLLVGFSFVFRFQSGFLVAGFIGWFIFTRKERINHIIPIVFGILTAIAAGILTDRWFYGEWTFTAWNYFSNNILDNKVSEFGINPWYFYFVDVFTQAIPPFSIVFILSVIVFIIYNPRDAITWALVPFLLVHFMVSHKETRFLYPIIGFLPILIIRSIETAKIKWHVNLVESAVFRWFAKAFWMVNLVFIVLAIGHPADPMVNMYRQIYKRYPEPATLFYTTKSPFHRALQVHYYKRPTLTIRKAGTGISLSHPVPGRYLFAFDHRDKEGVKFSRQMKQKQLIWSSFPEWARVFNINGWIDRTAFWYVYEIVPYPAEVIKEDPAVLYK
jgi:phosphatidylinositol glycan class B